MKVVLAILVGLGAAAALFARGAEPGPEREASCVECHADAHPGFERSGHALAATEPWYARSLALTPVELRPLCGSCHAPARTSAGVTCESCHLDRGAVLVPTTRALAAPHETRFAPALRDGRLCARCHTVDLPLGKDHAMVRLQDTPAEHALWRERTGDRRGCVDCHAGPAGAHFAGVRDPTFLARAVAIAIEPALEGGEVRGVVRLENLAGHAFPGGSRMREAWVRLTLVAEDGRRIEIMAERLSFRGDPADGETPKDGRLAPGETRRFPFRAPRAAGFSALECSVEMALVSLDFPDSHPMIPPGEPRVVPVSRARVAIPALEGDK